MVHQEIIDEYNREAKRQVELMDSLHNYSPTKLRVMLAGSDPYTVTKSLLARKDNTYGFTKLFELNHSDYTLESLVIREKYSAIFTEAEIITAKERLGIR